MKQLLFTLVWLCSISMISNAQEITLFPGLAGSFQYYQGDQRISVKDLGFLMLENEEAYSYWKKSRTHNTLYISSLGLSFGILALGVANLENADTPKYAVYGILATGIAAVIFYSSSNSYRKKAILTYNKSLAIGELRIGPSGEGLGVVLTF